jgi:diacylglycerol kinase (ATP)
MKGRPFPERLRYATDGILEIWRKEQSFRTQALLGVGAVLVAILLRLPQIWWAALAIVIGLVLVAETMNSTIEAIADVVHPDLHPSIKAAKDMAAGGVLLASLTALVVGLCLIFSLV